MDEGHRDDGGTSCTGDIFEQLSSVGHSFFD
jgi:hypothetical protein